jgi:hypothetical protein
MSVLTTEFIKAETGFKLKFSSYEELYPLFDLLHAHLPTRTAAAPEVEAAAETAEKPKKVKKAKKVLPEEAELLAPADAGTSGGSTPTLGATDPFRLNKYRLAALDDKHCVGRKIDEANPIAGTRPGDTGANGKVFPEAQCAKKATPGSLLCATCAKKEAEYLADTSKVPKGWYGRLDEPLFHKAFVVGCEWFLTKYPAGLPDAPVSAAVAAEAEKPKKAKKAEPAPAPAPAPEAAAPEAAAPVAEKPKKVKKAKTTEPAAAVAAEPEAVAEPEAEPVAEKPKKVKKATVAADSAPKEVEWVTFICDGVPLIRNAKSRNVYQCDRSKHRLEDMVQRDKYEGKWVDGRLDAYAEEEDE